MPLNNLQFIGNLKRMFPVFKQGSLSNDIRTFASTVWEDENQQQHQVMVFQYHYVSELKYATKTVLKSRSKKFIKTCGVYSFLILASMGLPYLQQAKTLAIPIVFLGTAAIFKPIKN
jgi:hypothetical protein